MAVKRFCNLSLLPPEIIEGEVLPRLPVKSVLRFKLVCKSWNLFISSNPDFIKSHLDLNPNNDSLILSSSQKIKYVHDYDSVLQGYTKIIGSVNGLVCLYNWHYEFEGIDFAIWNPATKHCLTNIPNLPDTCVDREIDIEDCFGFGFDSLANDFKVVYVITNEEQPLEGDIYSCNRRCWRKTTPSNFLFHGSVPAYPMPVTFRGSPYWLNIQPNGDNSRLLTVLWFDVRNEIFKILPEVGSVDKKQGNSSVLMNFRDSVAVMTYDATLFLTAPVDVYVLNDKCSGWSKMSIGPLIGKEPTLYRAGQFMLQCFKNDDILFLSSDTKLYCVNLQTRAIKSLGKEANSCGFIVYGCTYSESLVFIEGMMKFDEKEDEVGILCLKKA